MLLPTCLIVLLMVVPWTSGAAVEIKSCANLLKTALDEILSHQLDADTPPDTTAENTDGGDLDAAAVIPTQNTVSLRVERKKRSAQRSDQRSAQVPIGGAIYTRWGRTNCSNNDSVLVYKGYAGGSHYSHTGGGSNYLCLPEHPTWNKFTDSTSGQNTALVYGSEYEAVPNDFPFGNANAKKLFNHNVPCAVCQSKCRSSVLMVPAKKECFDGWFLEYSGYLAAGFHAHKARTEFVCVDENPEADVAGYRNEEGALFYPVQGRCGSLPCPPYAEYRELTCAVCTK